MVFRQKLESVTYSFCSYRQNRLKTVLSPDLTFLEKTPFQCSCFEKTFCHTVISSNGQKSATCIRHNPYSIILTDWWFVKQSVYFFLIGSEQHLLQAYFWYIHRKNDINTLSFTVSILVPFGLPIQKSIPSKLKNHYQFKIGLKQNGQDLVFLSIPNCVAFFFPIGIERK
jgi:hypothetical protein